MLIDTCICPDCGATLDITEYGRGMECTECRCKIDVFPNVDLYVETPVGTIGITLPKNWKEGA